MNRVFSVIWKWFFGVLWGWIAVGIGCCGVSYAQVQGSDAGLAISSTGVIVQKFRLRLIAENVANAATLKTETGYPYQKKYAVLEPSERGVRVERVAKSNAPFPKYFDPAVPQSDENGFYYFPNVNLPDEYMDLAFTEMVYEANVTAFKSAKSMYQQSLEILK